MENINVLKKRKLTWLLLFVGFCCVFGWIGMSFTTLMNLNNSYFATIQVTLQTVLDCLIYNIFYIAIGVIAFSWGIKRIKRTENKKGLIAGSIIPAAVLTPVSTVCGFLVMLLVPVFCAQVMTIFTGPNIVQSVDSQNGVYQAYVIDKPSIDGPNHHLYVRNIASEESTFVTNLPEDVDYNQKILWSPHNDLVVFCTCFKLIIYCPEKNHCQEVKLGGDEHWRDNGTFWVDYDDVLNPYNLQFPESGVFSYQIKGDENVHIVDMNKQ